LASIFGTEKDKVNCPFYFKTGACRHGDRCSRVHNKPTESQTVLISHMYNNPAVMLDTEVAQQYPGLDKDTLQKHFEDFYEEVYEEVSKFGEIEEMNVCDNLSAHLIGNVYVKFMREEDATKCITGLNGRFYAGRPIQAEYSPVTDFREASCRQFESGQCTHGGYCNFIHLKELSRDVRKRLFGTTRRGGQRRYHDSPDRRSRSRSPRGYRRSPPRFDPRDRYRDREYRDGRDYRGDRDYREFRERRSPPPEYPGDSYGRPRGGPGGPDRRDSRGGPRYDPYARPERFRERDAY